MHTHGWEDGKYLVDGFPRSFDNIITIITIILTILTTIIIYICICMCMYICMCVYIYIYVSMPTILLLLILLLLIIISSTASPGASTIWRGGTRCSAARRACNIRLYCSIT